MTAVSAIRACCALLPAAALAACAAGGTAPPRSTPAIAAAPPIDAPRLALPGGRHAAQVHMAPGLEGVIGADAAELTAAFGPARLDVIEGDARKLQFVGTSCVLDVYLYPDAVKRGEPHATYVEARRPEDGAGVDRAACVAALRMP